MPDALEIPLRGPKGKPVQWAGTIVSHGVAELPLNRVDPPARTLETTLPVKPGARTVQITERDGRLRIHGSSCATTSSRGAVGAGRMLRAPTVFEDVVKTI